MGSMGFGESTRPFGFDADGSVAGGMEVAMADLFGLLFAAEDDARFGAGALLVKKTVGGGKMLGACVQISAEE